MSAFSDSMAADPEVRRQFNSLARHQLITKILADIAADATICKMEGWDPQELPRMIRSEMDKILSDH